MMFRALNLLVFALGIAAPTRATPTLPLQHGEQLTYRVSWAIVPGAVDLTSTIEGDIAISCGLTENRPPKRTIPV